MTVWSLIPLITCLMYLALFVFSLSSDGRKMNRLFSLYLVAAAVWSFTSFMLHLNAPPQQTLLWNELLLIAMMWAMISYYHFIQVYTKGSPGPGVYLAYSLLFVLAPLSLNGFIVRYAYVVDGNLYHSLGNTIYIIGAMSLTAIGAVLVLLVRKYRVSNEMVERNRIMYLISGWSIMALLAYSNLVPSLAELPLDHIGNLANAAIIAYAIRKYQLFDIRLVLRRGLVYSSLTALFTTLYLLLLFIMQMFLHTWTGYSSLILAAGFALIIAVLFNPLVHFMQRWIDRLFYRQTYDYRQMLLHFSDRISNVLDLGELAQSILEPIVQAMHVKQAALLFPEPGNNDYSTRFVQQSNYDEPYTKLRFSTESPVTRWLAAEGEALRRESIERIPQFKGMWEVERIAIDALGVDLLCPIRSRGNLVGILALGKKQSATRYSDDEIDLLMTMSHEAAVVVDNARMLDSLKVQQLQVEQLLVQAVLAQEEERKRISADLHDGVAQWLVAVSYGVQFFNQALLMGEAEKARNELVSMETTIDKSLKELRRVVIGLRPPALDELGLTPALRQSLEELKAEGIVCRFTEEGKPLRLLPSTEIAVYRVVQEALTNIRRHADASRVYLRLQYHEDELMVEIRDNGKGFDFSQTLASAVAVGRVGVLGMKQRAEMLGGEIKIETSVGKGTRVTLHLPIPQKVEEQVSGHHSSTIN